MKNRITGSATLPLSSDPSGNLGYSLAYDYSYDEDDMSGTIEFSNIKFSGPGTWEEFSEGDDYPYREMTNNVMRGLLSES